MLEEERRIIETVLIEYARVFHDAETNYFKGTDLVENKIMVGDSQPISKPQYRVPYSQRDEIKTQIQQTLDKGVIR